MLRVTDLVVRYGEAVVVRGASLEVGESEWVALVGPNGAGKTSLIRAVLGLVRYEGEVHVGGREISPLPAWERHELGLGYVPEGRRLFPRLSVESNLRSGAYRRREDEVRRGLERIYDLFPRLAERRRQLAGTLSGGEQQMTALGRALMSEPRLIIVDEASLGLMPIAVELMFETLSRLHRSGVGIFMVEQNARKALRLAQRAYVMESGEIVLSGDAEGVASDPRIVASFVG